MEDNMKATFFFDTVLLKDDNQNFFGMTLTYEFIKNRYLQYFDEMTISTREKNKSQQTKVKLKIRITRKGELYRI